MSCHHLPPSPHRPPSLPDPSANLAVLLNSLFNPLQRLFLCTPRPTFALVRRCSPPVRTSVRSSPTTTLYSNSTLLAFRYTLQRSRLSSRLPCRLRILRSYRLLPPLLSLPPRAGTRRRQTTWPLLRLLLPLPPSRRLALPRSLRPVATRATSSPSARRPFSTRPTARPATRLTKSRRAASSTSARTTQRTLPTTPRTPRAKLALALTRQTRLVTPSTTRDPCMTSSGSSTTTLVTRTPTANTCRV